MIIDIPCEHADNMERNGDARRSDCSDYVDAIFKLQISRVRIRAHDRQKSADCLCCLYFINTALAKNINYASLQKE